MWEGDYNANTVYTCMQNGKMLKLFQEWGKERIKKNGGGGKFKYDISDIL
jgi:hypothetical protein